MRLGFGHGPTSEEVDARLREWNPETAAQARAAIVELIELADADGLDLLPSRAVEQEVLDRLDAPTPR